MFEVERIGKTVLFPNLFRIAAYEVVPQPGSSMCDVHVHMDGSKITFGNFRTKQDAKDWVLETFSEQDTPLVPPPPPQEDPFAKRKKR